MCQNNDLRRKLRSCSYKAMCFQWKDVQWIEFTRKNQCYVSKERVDHQHILRPKVYTFNFRNVLMKRIFLYPCWWWGIRVSEYWGTLLRSHNNVFFFFPHIYRFNYETHITLISKTVSIILFVYLLNNYFWDDFYA